MEDGKIRKYNYGKAIPLDSIPIEECNDALLEFADGSLGLEKCLRIMWQYGLKTHSCYPGDKNIFDIAYIVMEENEDVFCYLSEAFLNDDGIRIDIENGRQVIKFAGNLGEKNSEMIFLAQNILTGKKNHYDLVNEMIGKPFPDSWVRKIQFYDSNDNYMHWSSKVFIKDK
ncbi:MAG: hypothetical protein J6X02_03930 [Bacilli bacterium]|nr:hypothetical protein [Bacilli bacterium]